MNAAAMFVANDGTVYLNVFWEEGGRNIGIYKDGQCIGNAGHTHGWGYGVARPSRQTTSICSSHSM